MAGDELHEPLGMAKPSRSASHRGAILVFAGLGFVAVAGAVGALLLSANPHGGEPFAVATIPPPKSTSAADDPASTGSIRPAAAPADAGNTTENGVRVFRAGQTGEPGSGPLVIKVPDALGQSEVAPVDKRLVEMTRYGPLPKIAADGTRPSDVYARPAVFGPTVRTGSPRIALFIGGLGLNPAASTAAIDHMPAAVSLAFAPYGEKLDETVGRAKAAGHEVLLQLPMEAFGDDSHPGPHTLTVGATPGQTIDDLHWLMSRMGGYVGVTNFLGGRFTADTAAMTHVLEEIGSRGLIYVEDGTSRRSVGPALAPGLGIPAAKADVVLDVSSDPAALRAALIKLEAVARDRGSAIGVASDLPENLGPIAQFAASLDGKGIALVPVSALANTAPPAVAATP